MASNVLRILRRVVRVVAVVVLAAAIGYGLGYGISEAKGGEQPPPPPFTPVAEGADGTTGASGSPGRPRAPQVEVLSSALVDAKTKQGRERRRARVEVRIRARAGAAAASLEEVRLVAGTESVSADPNAEELAGGLLRAIEANGTATGELRFETAGPLTSRLRSSRRAVLQYDGGSRALELARR